MVNRPRPKSRRRLILACILTPVILLAAVLTWLALEVRAVHVAEPVATVDYRAQFREYAEHVAGLDSDSADRAWALLDDAVATASSILRKYHEELADARPEPRFDGDGFYADYSYVRDAIELSADMEREWEAIARLRSSGVFEALASFAEFSPGVAPVAGDTKPIMLDEAPIITGARRLAQARVASMRLALFQGDIDEVARAFDETLAIARTIVNAPALIWSLVGASIHAMAVHELRHQLMEARFDAGTCRRLLHSLDRHEPPPAEFGIEAERFLFLDLMQHIYTDDGDGDGYFAPRGGAQNLGGVESPNLILAFRARFVMQKRRETTDWLNRWFDANAAPVPTEEYQRVADYIDSGDNLVLSTFAPALDLHHRSSRTLRLDTDGLRLMLMLAIHRDVHGSYPTTLADLDDEFDPPHDPFSDDLLRYRLLDDDPHGRPYVLYSVGAIRRDGGGRDVEGGVDRGRVLRDPSLSEFDYILNPPRRGVER